MPKRRMKFGRKNEENFYADYISSTTKCFVCDDHVRGKAVQLILGRTPYSDVGLPAKIGQLIGDDFMVVVCGSDLLCSRCASLINQLDKLEVDLQVVKKTLTGYLATKYNLDYKEAFEEDLSSQLDKCQDVGETAAKQSINSVLTVINKPKQKSYSCENCSFTTIDCDALLPHYSVCVKLVHHCTACPARFETPDNLAQHINQAHKSKFMCSKCSMRFSSDADFANHMKAHFKNENNRCGFCDFTCSDANILKNHIQNHALQLHKCQVCHIGFEKKSNLDTHMTSHCEVFTCPNCPSTFQLKANLEKHMRDSCKSRVNTENGISSKSVIDGMSVKKEQEEITLDSLFKAECKSNSCSMEFFSCENCASTFLNRSLFLDHMKLHQEERSDLNNIISGTHTDVLNGDSSANENVCHIDDDLEDLFEKLHAESSATSLVDITKIQQQESAIPLSIHNDENLCEATEKITSLAFSTNIQSSNKSILSVESGMNCFTEKEKNVFESVCKVDDESSASFDGSNHLGLVVVEPVDQRLTMNTHGSDNSSFIHMVPLEGNQQQSKDIVNMAVVDQQQTLIYISGGESLDAEQQEMIIHNAAIDPESGSIQLLQYVFDTDSQMGVDDIPPCGENNDSNFEMQNVLKQGICEVKSELTPEESKDEIVHNVEDNTYMCTQCGFQTSILSVANRHLRTHIDKQSQHCTICNRAFSSVNRLLTHLETHTEEEGPVNCPFCMDEIQNSSLMQEHFQKQHRDKKEPFVCRFCSRKFPSKRACTNHEESHSEMFIFTCNNCVKKFPTEEELDDHVYKHHRTDNHCRYCSKEIENRKTLRNHEQRHMQESNYHECGVCKRVFKTKTGLRHHEAVHTGEFKFCCDFCGRGFMSRMMLEEHRGCHTKEERYVCDVCGRKFSFQSTYWIHRKWHDNPYPYKCNFCGRMFRHTSLLAVHKRKHTGERPYKCPHCPLTFPVGGTLKRHLILHTGAYPFNCETCKRGFTTRNKYAVHLAKVHGDFELMNRKSQVKDFKMVVHEPIKEETTEASGSWSLIDDLALNHMDDHSSRTSPSAVISGEDSLTADGALPTRVVEIVMDESYQPVATVTLAEVPEEGTENCIIPDIWYQ